MATDREQVKQLFEAALILPDRHREAFLGTLDHSLRQEVESLLASHREADSFLEKPPQEEPVTITRAREGEEKSPDTRQIGPYRILQEIGHGGMGVVYEAEQEKPVHRKVALKLIKWGMDTKAVIARFESERQALALMNHPNIASVFDAGATADGRPYFAMERVQGEPITEYCDKNRLTIKERLNLFIQVCEGVQHAHQKGIIHRDIKPSNILITIQDDKPVPKIIDFGVAKATSQRLTERTVYTELGQLIGTPEYMSPEQAEMTSIDIDTRTDVYSLGVVLYELLVGAQPFDAKALRQANFDNMRRTIREEEPPKPSTRLTRLGEPSTTAAKNRRVEVRSLERELRGDLDWLTMKALEKDRTRRYSSPSDLAADIQRHLKHEPVVAGPPSAAYRAIRFVQRHLFGVLSATAIAILLIALVVGMAVQSNRIARQRDRAEQEAATAKEVSDFLVGLFEVADPDEARGRAITAREILNRGADHVEKTLSDQPEVQARMMAVIGKVSTNLGLYSEAEPLLEQAVRTNRRLLGEDHPDTLTSMNDLADLYWYQRRLKDAEPLYLEIVGTRGRVLGEEHADTLAARYDLASLYHLQGRLEEAQQSYSSLIEAQRSTLGSRHPDVAASLHNLAALLADKGDYEKAEALHREALAIAREVFRGEHPDVVSSLNGLALLLADKGEYEEAELLHREALVMERILFGEEHPDVATSLGNLAWVLAEKGNYEKAEAFYHEALAMDRKLLGVDHPYVATDLANLARMYCKTQNYEDAESFYTESVDIYQDSFGPDHWRLAQVHTYYSECLMAMEHYETAEELLLAAHTALQAQLGERHRRTEETIAHLIDLYEAWGKPEKAAEYRAVLEETEDPKQ